MNVLEAGDSVQDRHRIGQPLREVGDAVVLKRKVGRADRDSPPLQVSVGDGSPNVASRIGTVAKEGEPLEESADRTLRIADEEVVRQGFIGLVRAVLRVQPS